MVPTQGDVSDESATGNGPIGSNRPGRPL